MQFSLKKDFQIPYLGSKLIQFSKEVPHVTFLHIYKYYHLCTIGYELLLKIHNIFKEICNFSFLLKSAMEDFFFPIFSYIKFVVIMKKFKMT
jgi:hypothetical protein